MKRFNLNQGSEEWLEFRRERIMASDAGVVIGVNPYMTPSHLWNQKKGIINEPFENAAMIRGKLLEEEARKKAEEVLGVPIFPCVGVHDELQFMGASFDGIDIFDQFVVEIKCPGERVLNQISQGKIPEYWIAQIQHQLFVSSLNVCKLVIYDGRNIEIISIDRDEDFIIDLIKKSSEFYRCLIENIEPISFEDDYSSVVVVDESIFLIDQYLEVTDKIKKLENQERLLKKQISDFGDDGNIQLVDKNGNPLLVMSRVQREGSVDWQSLCVECKIPEEVIAKHRKQGIGYYKFTKPKNDAIKACLREADR